MSKDIECTYDQKYLLSTIISLSKKYDVWEVFNDFLTMCAYAISNSVNYNDARENEYLNIINRYTKEEQQLMHKMLASLVNSLNTDYYNDVLGEIFEKLELQNKYKGQFFTSKSICDMLTPLTFNEFDLKKTITTKGYISVAEPACGSGRILYSILGYMRSNNIDYHRNVFIQATDISRTCSYMTYIQLSLYGANARVICGDTLADRVDEELYTPMALLFPIQMKEGSIC